MPSSRTEIVSENQLLPFLKWAGGKRWLAKSLLEEITPLTGRYHEAFLGGGALFFALEPESAFLSDTNAELINAYAAVRDNPYQIAKLLQQHQNKHSKEYYYKIREYKPTSPIRQAARFIYLNRTCWNGLYRVNQKGIFNVPIGTKNNVVLESDDWEKTSKLLSIATLKCQDFEQTIDETEEGDFVFADPPYTVKHNNNGFVKYNQTLFSWQDQIRLRNALLRAKRRGVSIIATNANHESIHQLYSKHFEVKSITRASIIGGGSEFRGVYEELIIR